MCLSAYNEFTHLYDLQQKLLRKLEIEMKNISDVLEHRRDYYIRLQKLSDGVIPLDRPLDLDALENSLKDRLNKLQISYSSDMGRKRYLENLLDEDEKEQEDTKDLECGICKTTMEERAILPCGHFFCKECITMWLVRHHKCPLCNQVM
jgi:E3 ubiquitin-protein ligase SHPRH